MLKESECHDRGCCIHSHGSQVSLTCLQEQQNVADVENGGASFHDSGSSMNRNSNTSGHLQDDPAAAKCWDIAASDVVICKRPDGSEWLLSSSDSGQVPCVKESCIAV